MPPTCSSIVDVPGTFQDAHVASLVARLNDDQPGILWISKSRFPDGDGFVPASTECDVGYQVPVPLWELLRQSGQRGRAGSDCTYVFIGNAFADEEWLMGNDWIGAAIGNAPPAPKPKKMSRRETELARVYSATVSSIAAMDGAELEELSEHLQQRAWRWTIAGWFFAIASCFFSFGGLPYFLIVSALWFSIVRDMRLYGEARAYMRVAASIGTVGDRIKLLEEKRNERL